MKLFHTKFNYRSKLFFIYSLIAFLSTMAVILFFYSYTSNILRENSKKTMEQTANNITTKIDSIINLMDIASTQVITSAAIQDILVDLYYDDTKATYFDNYPVTRLDAIDALSAVNSPLMANGRIGIFDKKMNSVSSGRWGESAYAFSNHFDNYEFIQYFDSLINKRVLRAPHYDDWRTEETAALVVSLVREIRDIKTNSFRLLGYVEVQQPYSMIESICAAGLESGYTIVIYDENNSLIYPYQTLTQEEQIFYQGVKNSDDSLVTIPWDNTTKIVTRDTSFISGWTVVLVQDQHNYDSVLIVLRNAILLLACIAYLLTFFVIFVVTRKLTTPINDLTEKVKRLSLDDPDLTINAKGNDELLQLSQAFDHTLTKLKNSVQKTLDANDREMDAHILALQAQMNPHFLFNTLMAINGVALQENQSQIASMCSMLAELLRYSAAYKEQKVTIADEITNVDNYLKLMKIRYEEFLTYEIDIDKNLYEKGIPKLILQPIVENSFSHGFKNKTPPYYIHISGTSDSSGWSLAISDNGCGFDEEFLREMDRMMPCNPDDFAVSLKEAQNSKIGGIGLRNSFVRLKKYYGDKLDFSMKNQAGAVLTISVSEQEH